MYGAHAIEHGSSRSSRWLRERRLRITLWTAAVEGLLYLVHVLHWWEAVVLAALAVGLWWLGGRSSRSYLVQQLTWIFAASQLLVLCVPIALGLVKALAIGVIAVLAIVGLVLLFTRKPA
jgi:hypothetical protein